MMHLENRVSARFFATVRDGCKEQTVAQRPELKFRTGKVQIGKHEGEN
ncbi:MAG: hypothetical protein IH951_13650 [Bacteroidetes bacterium]|nr:hypothetical protein [Bacteroidota bacterium]